MIPIFCWMLMFVHASLYNSRMCSLLFSILLGACACVCFFLLAGDEYE